MFKKMMHAFNSNHRQKQAAPHDDQLYRTLDKQDIEKYKHNLKTINYHDLLDFIVQEEIYKIDHGKLDANHPIVIDHRGEEEYGIIEDHEADHFPITIEEEYRFVLVKKAKPKPTLVMPTKILKQLQEPSDHRQSDDTRSNQSS
jgi:hypothetical protein